MKKFTIEFELEDETAEAFIRAIGYLKVPHEDESMTINEVFKELAEDFALTQTRPGCWEATNMQTVIDSHGWELHLTGEI